MLVKHSIVLCNATVQWFVSDTLRRNRRARIVRIARRAPEQNTRGKCWGQALLRSRRSQANRMRRSLVGILFPKTVGDKDCPSGILLRWQNYCTPSSGAMETYIVLTVPSPYRLSTRLVIARMKMRYLIMLNMHGKSYMLPYMHMRSYITW